MNGALVFVDEHVPGIYWDSKYATWDNFTGKPVDGYLANRIVGTRPLCAALERAREDAAALGFGLLLLMDAISHHEAKGIGPDAARNRRCLRRIMETAGFSSYACEWWHYTLRDEPYPDTYFDVPIA